MIQNNTRFRILTLSLATGFLTGFLPIQGMAETLKEEISFESAIELIVDSSASLSAAISELEAEHFKNDTRRYVHLPYISGSISESVSDDFSGEEFLRGVPTASATISMPVYRFGADEIQRKIARLNDREKPIAEVKAQIEAEMEASLLLVEYIKTAKLKSLQEKLVAGRNEILEEAEKRFKSGLLAAEEVARLRIDFSSTALDRQDANHRERLLAGKLATRLQGKLLKDSWPWRESLLAKAKDWDPLVKSDFAERHTIAGAALKVKLSQLELESARARSLPSLNLQATISKALGRSSDFGPRSQDSLDPKWSAALGLNIPIFSRFEDRNNIESAAKKLAAAEHRLEVQNLSTTENLVSATSTLKTSLDAVRSREGVLSESQANLSKTRQRFRQGKISANDLAADEARSLELEKGLILSYAELHGAVIHLCGAADLRIAACWQKLNSIEK